MVDIKDILLRSREVQEVYCDENGRKFSSYRSEIINPDGPTAIREIEKLRNLNVKLMNAVKLFLEYDSSDNNDTLAMMVKYNDAIEASRDVLEESKAQDKFGDKENV